MAKLIIKSGSQAGRQIELKDGLNRIGRNAANDIEINEPSISSFHCELQVAEIAVAVRDLNSTNGTFINEKQIVKGVLQRGDILTLGEVQIATELPEVNISVPEITFEQMPGAAF